MFGLLLSFSSLCFFEGAKQEQEEEEKKRKDGGTEKGTQMREEGGEREGERGSGYRLLVSSCNNEI